MTPQIAQVLTATLLVVTLSSCDVQYSDPDHRLRLRPHVVFPGNSHFQQQTIHDQCFLSNGVWCVPCRGGFMRRCSDIQPNEMPVDPMPRLPDLGNTVHLTDYEQQFFMLTGNLDGETYQLVSGWSMWTAGDEIEGPYVLNRYTDEGHAPSTGMIYDDWLDVSFLWRADWMLPGDDRPLPTGVTVGAYIDGDLDDDDPADLMVIRVSGPVAAVQAALEPLHQPGTDYEIEIPGGRQFP